MKKLEKEFIGIGEVKGFSFTQIKKNDQAFLYEVSSNGRVWYEVFYNKINKQFNCESYPRSKSFGLWAWSIFDYELAVEKFNEISNG